MNHVITISRQYGSGGREVGAKLAQKLGIPFYDNELISRAAKESGLSEEAFANVDKKATNSLLYSIVRGLNIYGNHEMGYANLSVDDQVYLAESNMIRKIASEGPCVIVGRCADYILRENENAVNIFVSAGLDYRVNRAITQYGVPEKNAGEEILKIDKRRANYYSYHADNRWGKIDSYHLGIRSDLIGIDPAVDIIAAYISALEGGSIS